MVALLKKTKEKKHRFLWWAAYCSLVLTSPFVALAEPADMIWAVPPLPAPKTRPQHPENVAAMPPAPPADAPMPAPPKPPSETVAVAMPSPLPPELSTHRQAEEPVAAPPVAAPETASSSQTAPEIAEQKPPQTPDQTPTQPPLAQMPPPAAADNVAAENPQPPFPLAPAPVAVASVPALPAGVNEGAQGADSIPLVTESTAPSSLPMPEAKSSVGVTEQAAAQSLAVTDAGAMPFSLPPDSSKPLALPIAGNKQTEAFAPETPPQPPPQPPPQTAATTDNGSAPPAAAADLQAASFFRSLNEEKDELVLNASSDAKPETPDAISLEDAVALALKNNFEVLADVEKSRSAYWDTLGSYSQFIASVDAVFSEGAERSQPASYNDASGNRVLDSLHHRLDRSITVRQPLIDLAILADILKSGSAQSMAEMDALATRESTALDTVEVYLKLLQAQMAVKLADQYKDYLDELSKRMQARVKGGAGVATDMDRIRSRSTLAESARIEALGEYENNLADFQRLTHITPARLKIPAQLGVTVPEDTQAALERAAINSPVYLSSLKKLDVAVNTRNRSFSNLAPKLSLEYSKDFAYDAGGSAAGNPVDGVYPDQTDERMLLVARWSLNGGTSIAEGLSGQAKVREMNLRSLDVRSRMEQGIRANYNALAAAKRREAILREAVAADLRVIESFDKQYKNGNRSLFELLDAYEQHYKARLDLMHITTAKAEASFQIRQQTGDLVAAILHTEH